MYVGNLPDNVGLTNEILMQFFNAALVSATLQAPYSAGGKLPLEPPAVPANALYYLDFLSLLQDTSLAGDPITMTDVRGKFAFMEARPPVDWASLGCVVVWLPRVEPWMWVR